MNINHALAVGKTGQLAVALYQGTTLQLAEKLIRAVGRGFYPRHHVHRINAGLQPLRYASRILGRTLDFFSKLFSRAATAAKTARALALRDVSRSLVGKRHFFSKRFSRAETGAKGAGL